MTKIAEFPKELTSVLHVQERILEIYQNNNLLKVIYLSSLDDAWTVVKIDGVLYDFNNYNKGEEDYKLTIYSTHFNEKEELVTSTMNFEDIFLKIEK